MGSRLGPNYACLFMGHIEEQIFEQYTAGTVPALYKRYIDDIVGATSSSKGEIEDFATCVNNFHPSLKFTWSISDEQRPYLDLYLKPTCSDRLITSIYNKETDTHSYLNYNNNNNNLLIPSVVKIPSRTINFSAYDASAVTRGILIVRVRK